MPGRRLERTCLVRKHPAVLFDDLTRSALQRQRTPVVSHALPDREHIRRRRFGQNLDVRKPLEPRRHTCLDARYLRLLEHDLRKPHDIRVARAPPWQVAVQARALGTHQLPETVHAGRHGRTCLRARVRFLKSLACTPSRVARVAERTRHACPTFLSAAQRAYSANAPRLANFASTAGNLRPSTTSAKVTELK